MMANIVLDGNQCVQPRRSSLLYKTLQQLKAGIVVTAILLAATTLRAEVVTWSGTAQSVSANTSVEALHVTAATTVTIAQGCTLTVDELIGDAAITKAGAGTIRGDFALAEGCTLTSVAGSPLTVTGMLTLPATGTVSIAGNATDYRPDDVVTLIAAGSVDTPAGMKWTVSGSLAESRHKITVFADAEGLKAKIVSQGTALILR